MEDDGQLAKVHGAVVVHFADEGEQDPDTEEAGSRQRRSPQRQPPVVRDGRTEKEY